MSRRQPLGINQTLWLALGLTVTSTVLGGSALYGYRFHQNSLAAESLTVQTVGETYAAQVGPLMLTGLRPAIRSFVENLAWHPDSSLIAILDSEGKLVAVRGNEPLLERHQERWGNDESSEKMGTWHVAGDPDRLVPELNLTAAPIAVENSPEHLGTLVYAARDATPPLMGSDEVWRFTFHLLLVSATGMVLGLLWLKQKVLTPLSRLAQHSLKGGGGEEVSSMLALRGDEIGQLARGLTGMLQDREEWRSKAVRLERSVDDRVAAETQHIARRLKRVEEKIWTDPLTKLGNRRLLNDKFEDILRAQNEAGQDLSIVMVDVDHFKALNDTLGHKAGDDLLTFAGDLLRQCMREQDLAVRMGGDEFLLIYPAVSAEDAQKIAERLVRIFAQRAQLLAVKPKPTMSAGVASLWKHKAGSADELLEWADQALYAAKKGGRSQVRILDVQQQAAASS